MEVMFLYPEEELANRRSATAAVSEESIECPFLDPEVMGDELASAVNRFTELSIECPGSEGHCNAGCCAGHASAHDANACMNGEEAGEGEENEEDNVSSITDAIVHANRQTYPGVARLCLSDHIDFLRESGYNETVNGVSAHPSCPSSQPASTKGPSVLQHIKSCSKKQTTID